MARVTATRMDGDSDFEDFDRFSDISASEVRLATSETLKSHDYHVISSKDDEHTDLEDDEDDVFDIEDFTNASPWERFISSIEKKLHEWKISRGTDLPPPPDSDSSGKIGDGEVDYSFAFDYYYSDSDSEDEEIMEVGDQKSDMGSVAGSSPSLSRRSLRPKYSLSLPRLSKNARQTSKPPDPEKSAGTECMRVVELTSDHEVRSEGFLPTDFSLSSKEKKNVYRFEWHYVKDSDTSEKSSKGRGAGTRKSQSTQRVRQKYRAKGQEYYTRPLFDLVSRRRDHTFDGHVMRKWFGLDSFLILRPATRRSLEGGEAMMLLSSVSVACDAANCAFPVFVPAGDYWQSAFCGRMAFAGVSTQFAVTTHAEPAFRHLAGIQDYFTEQLQANHDPAHRLGSGLAQSLGSDVCQTSISVSHTYVVRRDDWEFDDEWRDFHRDMYISHGLPWGPLKSPLAEFVLRVSWPYFTQGTYNENALFTDFYPTQAPSWDLTARFSEEEFRARDPTLHTPLAESLRVFLAVMRKASETEHWNALRPPSQTQILRSSPSSSAAAAAASTPSRLAARASPNQSGETPSSDPSSTPRAESSPYFAVRAVGALSRSFYGSDTTSQASATATDSSAAGDSSSGAAAAGLDTPLPRQRPSNVRKLFLADPEFGSSATEEESPAPPQQSADVGPLSVSQDTDDGSDETRKRLMNSLDESPLVYAPRACPFDSLLSSFVTQFLADYEDLVPSSLAESWSDFIDEVAQCWDTSTDLPRISGDRPDLRCCLLHQKLQLLNTCIRKRRENAKKKRQAIGREPERGSRRAKSRGSSSSRTRGGGGGFPERMTTVKPVDLWSGELSNDHDHDGADGGGGNESDSWGDFDLITGSGSGTGSGASSKSSTLLRADTRKSKFGEAKPGAKNEVPSTRVKFRGSGPVGSLPATLESEDTASMKVSYSDASESDSEASLSDFFDVQEKETEDDILPDDDPLLLSMNTTQIVAQAAQNTQSAGSLCWSCDDGRLSISKPKGVKQVSNMRLMHHEDRMINIPVSQDHPLLTSDMIEEQQRELEQLGTSREASLARAERQGAHLLSDMCAFRAANPCCVLADFIRWYSPNDWIPDADAEGANNESSTAEDLPHHEEIEEPSSNVEPPPPSSNAPSVGRTLRGRLSVRMRDPRSLWHRLWEKSTPRCADEQTPLFAYDEIGSKIIMYLHNLSPRDVFEQLSRIAISNCLHIISRTDGVERRIPHMVTALHNIQKSIRRFEVEVLDFGDESFLMSEDRLDIAKLDAWVKEFKAIESLASRATALIGRFPDSRVYDRLVDTMLRSPHRVKIIAPAERETITELFAEVSSSLPSTDDELEAKPPGDAKRASGGGESDPHVSGSNPRGNYLRKRKINLRRERSAQQKASDAFLVSPPESDDLASSTVSFGDPAMREFTLFACYPRPSLSSRLVPNRLYVCHEKDQFRVASAFSVSEF